MKNFPTGNHCFLTAAAPPGAAENVWGSLSYNTTFFYYLLSLSENVDTHVSDPFQFYINRIFLPSKCLRYSGGLTLNHLTAPPNHSTAPHYFGTQVLTTISGPRSIITSWYHKLLINSPNVSSPQAKFLRFRVVVSVFSVVF